jgi:quercetin dioxygenase-like cupin family protein
MRGFLVAAFLLIPAAGALAQPAAPVAAPAQQYDVPTATPQTVMILTRDFAPGQSAGRHIHHGVEMFIVIRGDFQLSVDGSQPRVFHAGDSFTVPRDVVHDAKNVGTTPVTLAITYVIDKGSPARIPVP